MTSNPLIFERLYSAPVSKVWQALTIKEQMKQWYFDLSEFKAETGFSFTFTGGPSPEKQYVHLCEITEVIPEKKLVYSWRYEGYHGISFVMFELFSQGDQTLLRLSHTGIESFPQENTDFAIHNFEEGWNHLLNVSLSAFIDTEIRQFPQ